MARRVIFATLLCWVFSSAVADQVERNRGTLVGFQNGDLMRPGLQFNYQVSFRIWSMLNEPVYNVKFTWSFDERARIEVPESLLSFWASEDRPVGGLLSELEPRLRDTIKPYEVKVRIDGHKRSDPMSSYYVIWDVGVPGASGSTSYNTPASRDWDGMFGHYARNVGEAEAKALVKDGFIADKVSIVSFQWHLSDYQREMDKRFPPGQKRALRRAAEKHIQLLADLQGLPREALDKRLDKVLEEVEAKRRAGDPDFMAGLTRMVSRFEAGLPAEMRNMNVDDRYQKALSEIQSEKEADLASRPAQSSYVFLNTYEDWLQDKRAELAARKQYATEIVSYTDTKSGLCGFKDESGAVTVPARYATCRALKAGLGIVRMPGETHSRSWGVVNSYGDEVIPTRYVDLDVENEESETPTFIVAHSVSYEGRCENTERIRELQRMDSSGEAIGGIYQDRAEWSLTCIRPLILHMNIN